MVVVRTWEFWSVGYYIQHVQSSCGYVEVGDRYILDRRRTQPLVFQS